MKLIFQLIPFLALALRVRAHGVLTEVAGTNGVTGQGFGVIASTPRDGTTRNPFQQDTSIIRDKEISKGDAGVCGRTLAGGNNDVTTQLNAAIAAGLPAAAEDGTVSMTLHQVNGDGAGPYTCEVSTDATGAAFTAMTVTTNVPGRNSRSNAKATDFALVAQMPAGTTCTGGANADACLVRCRNSAAAGPFGGCVAVTNAGSSNATATTSTATTAVGSASNTTASDTTVTDAAAADTGATDASATDADSVAATVATGASAVAPTSGATGAESADTDATDADDEETNDDKTDDIATSATNKVSNAGSGLAKALVARAAVDDDDDDDSSIHDAEVALASDLDRRMVERVRRSRIVGRRFF